MLVQGMVLSTSRANAGKMAFTAISESQKQNVKGGGAEKKIFVEQ
jgi:hypothetical protein